VVRRLLKVFVVGLVFACANSHARLSDFDGEAHGLSDYIGNGNWTLVMIWSFSCGTCGHEAPRIEAFHRRHADAGVQVLGISLDSYAQVAAARGFVREHGLTFPNLVGKQRDVSLMYLDATGTYLAGTPGFLMYDPRGMLRTYGVGPIDLGRLERILREPPLE
jgi:peroxiredoxin